MPHAPPRPCSVPGCRSLAKGPRCEAHAEERRVERLRETAPYTTPRWRAARAAYLAVHPTCQSVEGCAAPAVVVDHLRPHRGNLVLFWDEANWQGLCWSHHSHKTATLDHGFGHA